MAPKRGRVPAWLVGNELFQSGYPRGPSGRGPGCCVCAGADQTGSCTRAGLLTVVYLLLHTHAENCCCCRIGIGGFSQGQQLCLVQISVCSVLRAASLGCSHSGCACRRSVGPLRCSSCRTISTRMLCVSLRVHPLCTAGDYIPCTRL